MSDALRRGKQGRWHHDRGALARVVGDLLGAELKQLRPGGGVLAPLPWGADMCMSEDGLGLDSLERMEAASALSEALQLHESGVEDLLLAQRTFGQWTDVASHGLAHFDERVAFRTSGSSGQPKRCIHALGDLAQEVEQLAELFQGTKRIFTAVPAHHIYGFLLTVLLPKILGGLEVIDVRLLTPQALMRRLNSGDLVVSHPAHWSLVARHGGAFPPGVTGVSSTAPCPAQLAIDLCRSGDGLNRLVQIYGSSETAGVGWRQAPAAPFQLMPHWTRALDGDLLRECADGSSRSTTVQDVIEWLDDRHFHVVRRLDAAVQVGGINVFPQRIAEMLLTQPRVREAKVRLMTAAEGQRLKAFVVPYPGAETRGLQDELEEWANKNLSTPERPKAYTFGSQLPAGVNGKDCDWVC